MEAENWKQVKEILNDTLSLELAERVSFLNKSGASAEIRAEVESLLGFESESESLMHLSAVEFSKDLLATDEAIDPLIGQTVGAFQIIGELGSGGMGAVYLAKRVDGKFEQNVAIKMLRREFNTKNIRRRFETEKKIQAKLNHPNIATLIDSGSTDDGVPYLAMEYIEGESIDKFCRNRALGLKARLKLFNKVCDAVGHAHRNLIIHRDLKPSNIIVTKDGVPKLLDFGISKLLDIENSADMQSVTILGAMTPEYASPEQIKGEDVTTATDIYSLGVVLFKILTGTLPFDFKRKSNGDFLKVITEDEPLPPSYTSSNANNRSKIINNGNLKGFSSRNRLNLSELKGDIDNIVLKALRKETERRYQSVEQFSADIWRYIDGLPVLARPATVSYRAGKFFRRNKISVIAACLIFFSLIAGISVSLWQANVANANSLAANDARGLAENRAAVAKTEQEKSEKITKFMSKVFGYANPAWYAEGAGSKGDARVIDAIVDLSEQIDIEFIGQAEIQSELHHKFAEVISYNSGNLKPEEQDERKLFHARRALELRKQFYGEQHELVAKDMAYLYWTGGVEYDRQPILLIEAINLMRKTNPLNLNLAYMLEDYSSNLMTPGEFEKNHERYLNAVSPPTAENKYEISEKYLREALPVLRFHYSQENRAIFENECRLAYALAMQNKWTDFETHYQVCQRGEANMNGDELAFYRKTYIDLIESVLAKKK